MRGEDYLPTAVRSSDARYQQLASFPLIGRHALNQIRIPRCAAMRGMARCGKDMRGAARSGAMGRDEDDLPNAVISADASWQQLASLPSTGWHALRIRVPRCAPTRGVERLGEARRGAAR